MALYRNIAGLDRTGRDELNPYKLTRPITDGGGYTRVPTSETFFDTADYGRVFYDPGVVPYASETTVYQVQKDAPITQVQQVQPVQSIDLPAQDQPLTPVQTVTTVDVVNEPTKALFPLLTLALLYVTMIKGESLLGKNQRVAFVSGLGLLYYQFSKKAGTAS